jgi:hypothetical protein
VNREINAVDWPATPEYQDIQQEQRNIAVCRICGHDWLAHVVDDEFNCCNAMTCIKCPDAVCRIRG